MAKESEFVQKYLTPVAVLLGAGLIAVALIYGGGVRGTNPNDPNAAPEVDIANVSTDSSPYIGNPDAPTTIAVFYDYQCPFCKQFELAVTPELMSYVTSGKTKIVFKDFHFLGEDSITAALFGRAFFELYPDRFGEWFRMMMEAQDDEGDQGFGDLASIEALTAGMQGVDVARVTALMNEKKSTYEAAIKADYMEGVALGINGTPTIIVGKKLLSGRSPAQFLAEIKAELDAQL
ncbi:MAG TPA: thioredoxin domain-containing protein [Candidatus Paceibacterota bacterium]